MSERRTYRYRGTDRRGDGRSGIGEYQPGQMAAQVEAWFRQGSRELAVCPGDGPVPPGRDEEFLVAEILKRDGRRTWCAELEPEAAS